MRDVLETSTLLKEVSASYTFTPHPCYHMSEKPKRISPTTLPERLVLMVQHTTTDKVVKIEVPPKIGKG